MLKKLRFDKECMVVLFEKPLATVFWVSPKEDKFRTVGCTVIDEKGSYGFGAAVCSPSDTFSLRVGKWQAKEAAVAKLVETEGKLKLLSTSVEDGEVATQVAKEVAKITADIAGRKAREKKIQYLARSIAKVALRGKREFDKAGFGNEEYFELQQILEKILVEAKENKPKP